MKYSFVTHIQIKLYLFMRRSHDIHKLFCSSLQSSSDGSNRTFFSGYPVSIYSFISRWQAVLTTDVRQH